MKNKKTSLKDPFWNQIALDIVKKRNSRFPANWSEQEIKNFLDELTVEVRIHCEKDIKKADLLAIPFIHGKYHFANWGAISPSAFKNIFRYEKHDGKRRTKQQFAIYLGYSSVEAYYNEKEIPPKKEYANKKEIDENQENVKDEITLTLSKRLKGIAIIISTIVIGFSIYLFQKKSPEKLNVKKEVSPIPTEKNEENHFDIKTYGKGSPVVVGKDVKIQLVNPDENNMNDSLSIKVTK